jgi:hypothetical protein
MTLEGKESSALKYSAQTLTANPINMPNNGSC